MKKSKEQEVEQLLLHLRPWLESEHVFLADSARQDWTARLVLAEALIESGNLNYAEVLLESMGELSENADENKRKVHIQSLVELADLKMEKLLYDQAEDLLWKARNHYSPDLGLPFGKEEISLMIAQCRFGQGFVQDAIDRAQEVLRKASLEEKDGAKGVLVKAHQQLAWYFLNKGEIPYAYEHIKKAMELAPRLNPTLVDEGMKAEHAGDFQKAIESYFDAIE